MSDARQRKNRVKACRVGRNWTQVELAERAAISRAAVSAIEINRLVPSVAAALALAKALGCTVEDLFDVSDEKADDPTWAWPPIHEPTRYWEAYVRQASRPASPSNREACSTSSRILRYPVEATACGTIGHDGVFSGGSFLASGGTAPAMTLVLACCDPAVSILASELARSSGIRLIALSRSSREALALLGKGLVHAAGIHFAEGRSVQGNIQMVQDELGEGYRLVRAARWQEGLSLAPGVNARSVRSALAADLRWVGREPGSAARQCLDELRPNRPLRRLARDHRGVAEAVRCGWADIGVCLRLVSEEAGLGFLAVREESYDICYPASAEADPRIQALRRAMRSPSYRRIVGELPGFDTAQTGETIAIG